MELVKLGTKNIVPRKHEEGQLGTPSYPWRCASFGSLITILRNHEYAVGDVGYADGIPTWGRLYCIQGGTTSPEHVDYSYANQEGKIIVDGDTKWQLILKGKMSILNYDVSEYYQTNNFEAVNATTIRTPDAIAINIDGKKYNATHSRDIDITKTGNWDSELSVIPDNRAGKDCYIYAVSKESATLDTVSYVLSLNSTYPSGYTANNSRKVGGFHCLCDDAGLIVAGNGVKHPLYGYVKGDILPESMWDLWFRPKSNPEGMVYLKTYDVWVDIYLSSYVVETNNKDKYVLKSQFGGTLATETVKSGDYYVFYPAIVERLLGVQGKRFPTLQEMRWIGSHAPHGTGSYIRDKVQPSTAKAEKVLGYGGASDVRMISGIGCEGVNNTLGQPVQWCTDHSAFYPFWYTGNIKTGTLDPYRGYANSGGGYYYLMGGYYATECNSLYGYSYILSNSANVATVGFRGVSPRMKNKYFHNLTRLL